MESACLSAWPSSADPIVLRKEWAYIPANPKSQHASNEWLTLDLLHSMWLSRRSLRRSNDYGSIQWDFLQVWACQKSVPGFVCKRTGCSQSAVFLRGRLSWLFPGKWNPNSPFPPPVTDGLINMLTNIPGNVLRPRLLHIGRRRLEHRESVFPAWWPQLEFYSVLWIC